MPAAKRAKAKTTSAPIPESLTISPASAPGIGLVTVNIYDGTRQPIAAGTQILLTIHDGAQREVLSKQIPGPTIHLNFTVQNNFADNYSIVASAPGYEQAGFVPVTVVAGAPRVLDLMLLKKDASFHFANAKWSDILAKKPKLANLLTASVNGSDPGLAYGDMMENRPEILACLLNHDGDGFNLPAKGHRARLFQGVGFGRAQARPHLRLRRRKPGRPADNRRATKDI
jgi:hypothetical protein